MLPHSPSGPSTAWSSTSSLGTLDTTTPLPPTSAKERAGVVSPGHAGERRLRHGARDVLHVARVHRGRLDPDDHGASAARRLQQVRDFQEVRRAERYEPRCPHGNRPPSSIALGKRQRLASARIRAKLKSKIVQARFGFGLTGRLALRLRGAILRRGVGSTPPTCFGLRPGALVGSAFEAPAPALSAAGLPTSAAKGDANESAAAFGLRAMRGSPGSERADALVVRPRTQPAREAHPPAPAVMCPQHSCKSDRDTQGVAPVACSSVSGCVAKIPPALRNAFA